MVRGGAGLQVTGLVTAASLVLYADALLYTEVIRAMPTRATSGTAVTA